MDYREETRKIVEKFIENENAISTVYQDEGGTFGILITDGKENHHKEAFNRQLFSQFGIYGDDLKDIISMSKSDLEIAKKISKFRILKKEMSSIKEEIENDLFL